MLFTSVRDRPCRALSNFSSLCRLTTIFPSSRPTLMRGCKVRLSSPFGPLTLTVFPSTSTFTPLGMTTGSRPMRLISPHRTQQLAAETLLRCFGPGHQALRGGDDGDAEAATDQRQVVPAGVRAPARARDPLRVGEGRDPGAAD